MSVLSGATNNLWRRLEMVQLDITKEEQELLLEFLESYLTELRGEIGDTNSADVRKTLKHKEEVLKKILGMLG